mmetsp:Transcript_9114/g.20309  ORF Transcript_9114/g.20309 Transcript_9114/m.20309 type:complete len:730 (+) Transcript_9114:81-2270(+)
MANGVKLCIGAAGSLVGWAALVCALLPPTYKLYTYVASVPWNSDERRRWMHVPFAVAAGLAALKQLLCLVPVCTKASPNHVKKIALKPWHRSSIILRRVFHTPRWLARVGVPPSLCLLDLLVFAGFIFLNWCILLLLMQKRLLRGEAGCKYLQPRTHRPSHEPAGIFTAASAEGFSFYTGIICNIMMAWYCILPVSRRSVFLEILGLSWESAIKYHRWIGFHTFFVTALHSVGYIALWIYATGSAEYDPSGSMLKHNILPWGCADGTCSEHQLLRLVINLWGLGAFLLMLIMVSFSLQCVRRRAYELFYLMHMLWIPIVVMAQFHCNSIYYLAPGLACHCVDKMLGMLGHLGSIRAQAQRIGPDVLEIVVPTPLSYSVKTGQYVLLNVPSISVMQWHPLSVTWARHDAFALHIRAAGDWTQSLYELAKKGEVKVKVKGAYGKDVGPQAWGKDALVLWAGGVGLTYIYSIAEQASQRGMKVYLRFVVRTKTEEQGFATLLDSLQSTRVDIKMWVTRPQEDDSELVGVYGTATPPTKSVKSSGGSGLMMPMSSVVPSPMHAVICGVAIFSAYCGLEVATEITRNAIDPYMYPDKWYVTELRGMLIPVVFAIAGAVATMLMLVPISYYVQKKLRERRGRKDPERYEDRQALQSGARTPRVHTESSGFTTVTGCRPDMAAEWDSIATSLGAEGADVAVFVAGPNGLVHAVEEECGKRAWHVHRWHLDTEAWEW